MKKIISIIIICLICVNIYAVPSFAEEMTISYVDWYGDYTDSASPRIVITINSVVKYNQRVTATMYPGNVSSPVYTDYKRIDEITVKGNEKLELVIPIGDDLNYRDSEGNRHYKLKIKGNGLNTNNIDKVFDVYILTSNDINGDNGVLKKINDSQTKEDVLDSLSSVFKALRINASAITDTRIGYFLSVKSVDFSNNFSTISDVECALKVSELLEYLKSDSSSSSDLKTLTEKYKDEIKIDILDPDYVTHKDTIYQNVCSVKNTFLFNNTVGINSAKSMKAAIEQYQALNAINALTEVDTTARLSVPRYYSILGVPEEYIIKFDTISTNNSSDADKVLRLLCDGTFSKPSDIVETFKTAIDGILNSGGSGEDGSTPDDGSGGGGSGGSGGSSYSIQGDSVVAPQARAEFKDCDKSFWAYSYINELQTKNIISGYSDGNFYPSNKVTREEFVKMIILSVGLYDSASECDFSDVSKSDWYYRYVASAVNANIINGLDNQSFGAGKYISREDMAVITARILKRFNKVTTSAENQFSDRKDISEYAIESVNLLAGMQILNGFEDGSIRPKDNLTRAEAAKIIWMVMKTI